MRVPLLAEPSEPASARRATPPPDFLFRAPVKAEEPQREQGLWWLLRALEQEGYQKHF